MNVNMDYYGEGDFQLPKALTFNYKGFAISQQLDYGITKKFYLGIAYSYTNFIISLKNDSLPDWIKDKELSQINGSLKPTIYYDSRDNIFTPNKGILAKTIWSAYRESFGGGLNYDKLDLYLISFIPVKKKLVVGLRLDARFSNDNTPFYSKPYIDLRGVPIMRYQGKYTTVIENEEKYNITERWAMVGFIGMGKAFNDYSEFWDADYIWSGGAGFRYMLSKPLNMYAGCDIARGPENWAFYIIFGSAWGRY